MKKFSEILEEGANKGDVAEVIFGASMFAHFTKQTNVKKIIKDAVAAKASTFTYKTDIYTFKVNVPAKAMTFFEDDVNIQKVEYLFSASAQYLKQATFLNDTILLIQNNDQVDNIIVDADGVGDQKGTKADIKISINGKKITNQVSLKVDGGQQFAQISGHKFEKQELLWQTGLGLNISNMKKKFNEKMNEFNAKGRYATREDKVAQNQKALIKRVTTPVYVEAAKQLNVLFGTKDKEFIARFIQFIKQGIAGDEAEYIELVKLTKNSFKSVKVGSTKFENDVKELDLTAIVKKGDSPEIIIKDKTTGKALINIRYKTEVASKKVGGEKVYFVYPRNLVEAPSKSILFELGK